ncbi:hypothetical protein AMTRI_Chr03g47790 [Amborella trichopoda]
MTYLGLVFQSFVLSFVFLLCNMHSDAFCFNERLKCHVPLFLFHDVHLLDFLCFMKIRTLMSFLKA